MSTATRRVMVDAYNWQTPAEGLPGRYELHTSLRDEIVDFPEAEAARGDSIVIRTLPNGRAVHALEVPEQADRLAAELRQAAADGTLGRWTDEQLLDANVEEISAYVTQHPDEVDRVVTLEETRDRPRKGVLELRDGVPPDEK
jgi:hypothetical protein